MLAGTLEIEAVAAMARLNLPIIPAMTTDAERFAYYRLVREGAGQGAIVELGAWLGASTAFIAAALRDSGLDDRVHVYDKFVSKQGHVDKVDAFYRNRGLDNSKIPIGAAYDTFCANLGPLMAHVQPYQTRIETEKWTGGPISVFISDAPKRVPQIAAVMTNFRSGLVPGTMMAWQDFCHFPSYEIPACLYRLADRIEFVEAVVPGTTLIFRITSAWEPREVSTDRLALSRWSPMEIGAAWSYWLDGKVPAAKADLFRCGRAMFLCDLGHHRAAVDALAEVLTREPADVIKKWKYLDNARPDFVVRYAPLFKHLRKQGALELC